MAPVCFCTSSRPIPSMLPITMPRPTILRPRSINMRLTIPFVVPKDRSTPIMLTRSSMRINRLDTSVNPATHSIRTNITATLVSSSDSQLKYMAPLSAMVSTG